MTLSIPQLEDLFGSVPSQRTMAQLDYEALRPVVTLIQKLNPDDNLTKPGLRPDWNRTKPGPKPDHTRPLTSCHAR